MLLISEIDATYRITTKMSSGMVPLSPRKANVSYVPWISIGTMRARIV